MEPSTERDEPAVESPIAGVLLTAGESSRMGRPKALIPFGRSSFSRCLLESLRQGGIERVLIIVGHDPGPIVAHLCDLGPAFVYNRFWPKGQLSSLQAAIRACSKSAGGILVALVDQPGIRPTTIRRLVREHQKNPDKIIVAAYRNRPGHPVVFPRRFFSELLRAPISRGARVVVRRHLNDRELVSIDDYAIVRDVDTPRQLSDVGPRAD